MKDVTQVGKGLNMDLGNYRCNHIHEETILFRL